MTAAVTLSLIFIAVLIYYVVRIAYFNGPTVKTITKPEHDPQTIGDGAWRTTRANYPSAPRSARVRDIEPRGS